MESFLTLLSSPQKAPAYWRPSHTVSFSSVKMLLVGHNKTIICSDRKTSQTCFLKLWSLQKERKKRQPWFYEMRTRKFSVEKVCVQDERIPCGPGNLGERQVGFRCSNLAGNIVTFPGSHPPINFMESTVEIYSSEKWSD